MIYISYTNVFRGHTYNNHKTQFISTNFIPAYTYMFYCIFALIHKVWGFKELILDVISE
jgi:hypothetical protein